MLIDARLPGFQADAYAERLKQTDSPVLPVVLILPTAGAMAGSLADRDVFAATIRKPLRRREIRQMLRHVLLGEDSAEVMLESPTIAEPTAMAPAGRYRLLLAEDGRVNQIVATAMLERAGYAVDVVGDGISALHALEARSYDLVLMDIHMPEADGFQATASIRALGNENANVSIVAMTANALADQSRGNAADDRGEIVGRGQDRVGYEGRRNPSLIAGPVSEIGPGIAPRTVRAGAGGAGVG